MASVLGGPNPEAPPESTAEAQAPGCGAGIYFLIATLASLLAFAAWMHSPHQHPPMLDPVSPVAALIGAVSLAFTFSVSARRSVRYEEWVGLGAATLAAMPAVMFPAAMYCMDFYGWPALVPLAVFLVIGGWVSRQRWLAVIVAALAVAAIAGALSVASVSAIPTRHLYLASILALCAFGGVPALVGLVLRGVERTRARRGRRNVRMRVLATGSLFAAVFAVMAFCAVSIAIPRFSENRDRANVMECFSHLHSLCSAMMMYAQDNADILPPAGAWSDAISEYVTNRSVFVCPTAPQRRSGYAFNRFLGGVRVSDIADPENTVLLYESDLGWNGAGGPGALASPPRYESSNLVAFTEGNTELVTRGDEGALVWQPRRAAGAQKRLPAKEPAGQDEGHMTKGTRPNH